MSAVYLFLHVDLGATYREYIFEITIDIHRNSVSKNMPLNLTS